jgi:hypothetical protein
VSAGTDVQVAGAPAVLVAGVEQPAGHPGVQPPVAQGEQRRLAVGDGGQRGSGGPQVDDGLGRQAGNRGTADVLKLGEQAGQGAPELGGRSRGGNGPVRAIVRDLDRHPAG